MKKFSFIIFAALVVGVAAYLYQNKYAPEWGMSWPEIIAQFEKPATSTSEAGGTQTVGSGTVSLEGTTFRLTSYNGTAIPQGRNYTLSFEDGRLAGKFCNTQSGSYTVSGGMMSAPMLIATKMFCMEPEGLMDMEDAFGRMLSGSAAFMLDGSTLTLAGGGTVFVYTVFMD